MMPSVVIVDDNVEFCDASSALLREDGFDVVACAYTGSAGIEAAVRLRPDVVLLDVQLPDIDGLEVARVLAALDESPAVVLVSSRDASSYGASLAAAPVRGFIDKVALDGAALAALM